MTPAGAPARIARALAWIVALAAILAPLAGRREPGPPRGLAERLLGPIAGQAARIQWVRVDLALRAGDEPLACERAETALALAPGDTQGWIRFAHHFLIERASAEREPEPSERRRWFEIGLAVLARGERVAREPAEIAIYEGALMCALAALDEHERPFPGDERQALERGLAAFERAARAGSALGLELAHRTSERLAALERR